MLCMHRQQAMNRLQIYDVVSLVRYAMRFGVVSLESQPEIQQRPRLRV